MTCQETSRRRWFAAGCLLTVVASLGLITFPLTWKLPHLSDGMLFSLACGFTILMGLGATVAIFNSRRPHE
jgi:hypothetical protein